ncbi:hypothetical protein ACOJUR_15595 [Alicyclobacillus tolerans]|uniref:Homing endonuclease LAGLIDADG domain-containing protein n=1 Tax=Alicyclobacillus tolerans TaxID=90970 RepID=A0ABT9LYI9_9BACL|nr:MULTISPECIES: hypothetical protein [Alicyclobacillus]MDP9729341.1 hypothetical protein [Alicyclobacillus tengchongensis]QRF24843.1 hypothetical protein FY534_13745 [Alicyclobacillus sp. TC]
MQIHTSEYRIFEYLWERSQHRRRPSPKSYQAVARNYYKRFPEATGKITSLEMLLQQFGSFHNATISFMRTYYLIHGGMEIPDYWLGWMTNRVNITWDKRGGVYLRIIEKDSLWIDMLRPLLEPVSIFQTGRGKSSKDIRSHNLDLIFTVMLLWETNTHPVFRPTLDFLRGYIEGHSFFTPLGHDKYRLTIHGPLTEACRHLLVNLGATSSTQILLHKGTPSWNIHTKSIRRIRETLYPQDKDFICHPEFREQIWKI